MCPKAKPQFPYPADKRTPVTGAGSTQASERLHAQEHHSGSGAPLVCYRVGDVSIALIPGPGRLFAYEGDRKIEPDADGRIGDDSLGEA